MKQFRADQLIFVIVAGALILFVIIARFSGLGG
jgi:hypothetical protein